MRISSALKGEILSYNS